MIGRPMQPAKTPLGEVLQELMAARGIETIGELGVRLRKAGYRRIYQSVISQWMCGVSKPQSIPRLCFYLDNALTLTEEEKAAIAAAVGWAEYPVPRKKKMTSEPRPSLHPHLQP